MTILQSNLVTASAMAAACAALSVFVVLRRWAFIGEGIAHAGFGGAGTAWILSLLFPTAIGLSQENAIFAVAVIFCFAVAIGIAYVTRREQVRSDTAIGIFLVASLAWGFAGYYAYTQLRHGQAPPAWGEYVLGKIGALSPIEAAYSFLASLAVLIVVWLLGKEILCYTFDPVMAEVSGVRVTLIHYLLIALVTLTIVTGMRIMGSLLVTALLVLPGAIALQVSRNLRTVIISAIVSGIVAGIAGPLLSAHWRFIPTGPAIVLVLILQFLIAYIGARLRAQGFASD